MGIAVGFGTQSIVRDYFNGRADPASRTSSARATSSSIAGVSGTVEDFSLRRTTLRDLDGVVHTVPNGEIKVASNRTRVWARINQDVTVAYGTDIEKATRVVNDVGKAMAADPEWRRRVLEAPHVERIEALGEYGITLKILGLVRATEQWAAGGELRKRLLAAFATHGIEIPRPQRVVLAREPELDPFAAGRRRPPGADPGRPVGRTRTDHAHRTIRAGPPGGLAARRMARPSEFDREAPVSVEPGPTGRRSRTSSPRTRTFPPDPAFTAQANATAGAVRRGRGATSRRSGRGSPASGCRWSTPFDTTLEWDLPFAKWFVGGKLNVAYNCVDRHVENGLGDKVAYHWIGEPGDTRTITYADLHARGPEGRQRAARARRRRRATGSRSTCR